MKIREYDHSVSDEQKFSYIPFLICLSELSVLLSFIVY
jgi:hypothetical protein